MQSPDHTPGLAKSTPRSRCGRRCAARMGPACSECMQRVLESESAAVGFPNGDAGRPDRFPETEMADGQLVQLLAAAQMEDVANSLVCFPRLSGRQSGSAKDRRLQRVDTRAGVGRDQAGGNPRQRRFPGAVAPGQADPVTRRNRQAGVGQAGSAAEREADLLQQEGWAKTEASCRERDPGAPVRHEATIDYLPPRLSSIAWVVREDDIISGGRSARAASPPEGGRTARFIRGAKLTTSWLIRRGP